MSRRSGNDASVPISRNTLALPEEAGSREGRKLQVSQWHLYNPAAIINAKSRGGKNATNSAARRPLHTQTTTASTVKSSVQVHGYFEPCGREEGRRLSLAIREGAGMTSTERETKKKVDKLIIYYCSISYLPVV